MDPEQYSGDKRPCSATAGLLEARSLLVADMG
jgi:hypothetical protein